MAFGSFMINPFRSKSRIAGLYYRVFGVPVLNMHLRWRAIKKIVKGFKSPILDVGCGDGAFSIEIAKVTGGFVVGFDIDREDILFAKKVASKRKISSVSFLVADARNMPFKKEVFKATVCLEVLEHVIEDHLVISESSRVLEKNGQLVITSVLPAYTLYSFLPIFPVDISCKDFYREMDHARDGYSIGILRRSLSINGFKLTEHNEFVKFFGAIGVRYLDFLLHYRAALGSVSEYVKILAHPVFLILTKIDEFLPIKGKELMVLTIRHG